MPGLHGDVCRKKPKKKVLQARRSSKLISVMLSCSDGFGERLGNGLKQLVRRVAVLFLIKSSLYNLKVAI